MKKLLLIFTFVLPLLVIGQNWSPTGATWYYGFSAWQVAGYYKIEYIGDTTINSIQCKKLCKSRCTKYIGIPYSDSIVSVIGTEYTYADSDRVYIFKHNQFYTLYDFSAQVGNTWTIPEIKHYNGCDTIGSIRVDSIGTTTINSQALRYICVSLTNTAQKWGWNAKIVERIGPIKPFSNCDYLFPVKFDNCGMNIDEMIEGGNFRCYSDSTLFNYSSNIAPACDFITSINSIEKPPNQVKVFPNPASNLLTLQLPENTSKGEIKIYDFIGQQIFSLCLQKPLTLIDISGFESGLYIIEATSDKNIFIEKFIKQ